MAAGGPAACQRQPQQLKSASPIYGPLRDKAMFPLTPPKQLTFLISVVLAIAAIVVRYLVYTGVQMPPAFPTGGFLLLLLAYLVLVVGNLFEGA
jgi:hypothetical protein